MTLELGIAEVAARSSEAVHWKEGEDPLRRVQYVLCAVIGSAVGCSTQQMWELKMMLDRLVDTDRCSCGHFLLT